MAILLDAGATIDAADRNATTPLHVAARAGQLAVVDVLLARGADASRKNSDDDTPLGVALETGRMTIADRLLPSADPGDINVNLLAAVSRGELAVVEKLLAHGGDPNFVSSRGNSPLGVAKKKRNKVIEAALLAKGARVLVKATVRRAVPPPPTIASGERKTDLATGIEDLAHSSSVRRRRAARVLEKRGDARASGALVNALAGELADTRTWETQRAMADALGVCAHDVCVIPWLQELVSLMRFEATVVPWALARAAGHIALRNGEELSALLTWSLTLKTTNEQRLAVLGGLMNVAGERRRAIDQRLLERLKRLLDAPGPVSPRDAMLERAREAFRALP
ncbi:hypothetical protein BH11MYX4_BH11MYX4_01410 [soil metagenome]